MRADWPRDLLGASVVEPARAPDPGELPSIYEDGGFRVFSNQDRTVVQVDGTGSFAIEAGDRVEVALDAQADDEIARAYLRTTVVAFLLAQRQAIALHANAVEVNRGAVLIAGDSGAGKSTTSAALLSRGHRHLADDLSVLRAREDVVTVEAATPGMRIAPETAEAFGLDITRAEGPDITGKLLLRHAMQPPRPVLAIVVLTATAGARPGIARVRGAAAVSLIEGHVYRSWLLRRVWATQMFDWTADVVSRTTVHALERGDGEMTVEEVADAVERVIAES